jgi:hypothetical protein
MQIMHYLIILISLSTRDFKSSIRRVVLLSYKQTDNKRFQRRQRRQRRARDDYEDDDDEEERRKSCYSFE